jgi:hypothetical protein
MARLLLVALLAFPAFAATPPKYHLHLEANPAAPFPFLSKFGTIDLHIYGGGVHAETIWLNGFSRNGSNDLTVMNPLGRMYFEMPITRIATWIAKLGASKEEAGVTPPQIAAPLRGFVKGIPATRYRIVYGPQAWIDLWTTTAIPENAQVRRIVNEIVASISPATAVTARKVPGAPIYVELNFRRYKKLTLVTLKELALNNIGEDEALKVGAVYAKAPFSDAILK